MSPLIFDHVGIAVPDLDVALQFWSGGLGAPHVETEEVPGQKVRVAFLDTGPTKTELLEPTDSDSPSLLTLEVGCLKDALARL